MLKKIPLLFLLFLFSCDDKKEITTQPDPAQDSWGISLPSSIQPEVFAANDVDQSTVDLTLKWYKIAADAWGNYGPLEVWIVGKNAQAAIDLDKRWCDRRLKTDAKWNTQWDCANGDPYVSGSGWSPFYRYVTEGGAAVSTYRRDYIDYHFLTIIMSAKYPGPEEEDYLPVTLHEYFHVYQHSHILDIEKNGDKSIRGSKNGGEGKPWFAEGGAEYMAQLLYSIQPEVKDGYLKEIMQRKHSSVAKYKTFGKKLNELSYSDPVGSSEIGAWFIAYLVHSHGEEVFRLNFYKDLNSLGFESSFLKHFGKSSKDYLVEFDRFLDKSLEEALKIIP